MYDIDKLISYLTKIAYNIRVYVYGYTYPCAANTPHAKKDNTYEKYMARINLIHAALDAGNVDICLDDDVVLADVAYSDYANFCCFAGQTYCKLHVKEVGTSTTLAYITCPSFPCEGDTTIIIHWDCDGDKVIISFYNNYIKFPGNFLFRHAAGVGEVNVCKTDTSPVISLYTEASQGDVNHGFYFPEGTNEVTIKLAKDDSELIVAEVENIKNKLTIFYLVGKAGEEGSPPDIFDTLVETINLPSKCLTYWNNIYQGVFH